MRHSWSLHSDTYMVAVTDQRCGKSIAAEKDLIINIKVSGRTERKCYGEINENLF